MDSHCESDSHSPSRNMGSGPSHEPSSNTHLHFWWATQPALKPITPRCFHTSLSWSPYPPNTNLINFISYTNQWPRPSNHDCLPGYCNGLQDHQIHGAGFVFCLYNVWTSVLAHINAQKYILNEYWLFGLPTSTFTTYKYILHTEVRGLFRKFYFDYATLLLKCFLFVLLINYKSSSCLQDSVWFWLFTCLFISNPCQSPHCPGGCPCVIPEGETQTGSHGWWWDILQVNRGLFMHLPLVGVKIGVERKIV